MTSSWRAIGDFTALGNGQHRHLKIDEFDVLLTRIEGRLHAVDDICTHAHACLHEGRVRGHRVICPLHGASFDLRTGAVLGKPATQPLRRYELREAGTAVEIDLSGAPA